MAVQQLPDHACFRCLARPRRPRRPGLASGLRMVLLALVGTALLTLSAKLKVPFYPVPMTMQTLVVLMLGAAYGSRLATATVVLYLVEGALGLPVFADTPALGIGLRLHDGPDRRLPRSASSPARPSSAGFASAALGGHSPEWPWP